ncbi:hypothetical protein OHU17_01020 [Streptomyces goshikiensis]|uniref:Uncharacterized protein n=1 Tax=Streptomyces goshikiensis TaxID=1942 RepID=A0ABZ1RDB9_9ACTN|nr:hypothetical protein [Streptomyces goshikiensis]WSX95840.1 hypothetical protein OG590_00620 [Streptomyces goshikiensis]
MQARRWLLRCGSGAALLTWYEGAPLMAPTRTHHETSCLPSLS